MNPRVTHEHPLFYLDGKPFDLKGVEWIELDGSLTSDLEWKVEPSNQLQLFHLQLDINTQLPLEPYKLAIDHFVETVWSPQTVGLCIYKGEIDADLDPSLYYKLTCDVPEGLPLFLLFDESRIISPTERAFLTSRARFDRFALGLTHSYAIHRQSHWDPEADLLVNEQPPTLHRAICLPKSFPAETDLAPYLDGTYRIVCEELLSSEWDDLDQIYAPIDLLSNTAARMLNGFEAAGGQVLSI